MPATTDVTAGNALFGVKTGAAVADTGNGSLAIGANYSSSAYKMNYVSGDTTGVTGVYGDEIYSTPGYANSLNMPLTFGASVSPKTPAGTYSADLSLIATGTF